MNNVRVLPINVDARELEMLLQDLMLNGIVPSCSTWPNHYVFMWDDTDAPQAKPEEDRGPYAIADDNPNITPALRAVMSERIKQIVENGYDDATDSSYTSGQLVDAAIAYAAHYGFRPAPKDRRGYVPSMWPWRTQRFKPKSDIEDLVRAAALLIAEVDRRMVAAAYEAEKLMKELNDE